jgi:hypothetical protein
MSEVGKVTSKKGKQYRVLRRSDGEVALMGAGVFDSWRGIGIKVKSDAEALVVAKKYVDSMS